MNLLEVILDYKQFSQAVSSCFHDVLCFINLVDDIYCVYKVSTLFAFATDDKGLLVPMLSRKYQGKEGPSI